MSVSSISSGNSGILAKVSARIGRLQAKVDRVRAKLEDGGNAGQLRKADRLLSSMADGQLLSHPSFQGNNLIYTAIALGNRVNFGHAMKNQSTQPAQPPTTQEPPTTTTPPSDTTTPPADTTTPPADMTTPPVDPTTPAETTPPATPDPAVSGTMVDVAA